MSISRICNSTDLPFKESRELLIVVYSFIFAIGLPANCLTAFVTLVQICRKNITAIYLFGLSLCNIMYLSTLPLWILYVKNDHHWQMGTSSCLVTGYIFFCNIYISILLLCCISIDHYKALVRALESRGKCFRSQKTATMVTVAFFGIIAAIYCPVFFNKSIQEDNIATCFETPLSDKLAYYNISRFFLGFLIPLGLLLFTNYRIFQSIKTSCSLNPDQKAKVRNVAIAIISVFVLCFAPYHFVLLVRAIFFFRYPDEICTFEKKIYTTSVIFLCFSTANSVADPFIYVLAGENVRREIYRTCRVCGIHWPDDSQ
ncbi:probable G-protein coupled receptor 132 [Protobothrops mucrosquamatus]|uniref:probable G-protein coupled receptor 132 n=1 Tax=Protobothrops mucrosquamatus TaxID=103944 RepID=UPI000775B0D7|nr:probable G-protein coupled receptor 132 [Protobothrops mucrosquamatus]